MTWGRQSRSAKVRRKRAICSCGSPLAVGNRQIFGRGDPASPTIRSQIASLPALRSKSWPPRARIREDIRRLGGLRNAGFDAQRRLRPQEPRGQSGLQDVAPSALQPVGPRLGARGNGLDQLVSHEAERGTVLRGEAGRHPLEQVAMECTAAITVPVVDGVAVPDESESGDPVDLRVVAATASANQHSEPALSPHMITPASYASRSIESIPWARQTPSR